MNYELFHIYVTSFHCTGRYELNKLTSLSMCGFIAQLVEHRTGIAEVMGSNPVEALIFFRLLLSNCLNWKIYCDDHTSLSFTALYHLRLVFPDTAVLVRPKLLLVFLFKKQNTCTVFLSRYRKHDCNFWRFLSSPIP